MAEGNDYSAIGPLNAAAQRDAGAPLKWILLDIVVTVALLYLVGTIANSL